MLLRFGLRLWMRLRFRLRHTLALVLPLAKLLFFVLLLLWPVLNRRSLPYQWFAVLTLRLWRVRPRMLRRLLLLRAALIWLGSPLIRPSLILFRTHLILLRARLVLVLCLASVRRIHLHPFRLGRPRHRLQICRPIILALWFCSLLWCTLIFVTPVLIRLRRGLRALTPVGC